MQWQPKSPLQVLYDIKIENFKNKGKFNTSRLPFIFYGCYQE
jgi:hypothetical protein